MIPSKLGVHIVQGPRNGFGAYLARLRDAGKVAVVKCVDDFGAAWEAKNAVPGLKSLTVGRVNGTPDPATGEWVDLQGLSGFAEAGIPPLDMARWYLNLVRPKWTANPWIDVWETCNEWSSWWEWQADFYVFLMGLAGAEGFKMASWACSTGNPPESAWPAIGVAAQYAKQHGHYLSMHEYGGVSMPVDTLKGTEPWHALRYRALYEFLRKMDADAPLIISECGQSAGYQFIGTEQFISDFAWYDSELAKDSYVVCAAAWTLGNWQAANFQDALPALADYIATASYPDPVEPPPPPPPDDGKRVGDARVPYSRLYYRVNQRATADQWLEAARLAYPTRSTVGFSNDDAGIGVGLAEKKIVEVGGEFTPGVIEAWYQTEYGVPPENVDHIPYPGTQPPPTVEPFKLSSPVPSIPLVITDPFNAPRPYANGKHEGVDLRAVDASGRPVDICACAAGKVVADQDVIGGSYGITVVLEHVWPNGHTYRTWYAHLTRNYVTLGQQVTRGQPIGLAGTTGNSTGIHLHLSLQDIGHGLSGYALPDVVDPTPYLPLSAPPPPPPTLNRALVGLHLRANGLDHNDPSFAGELDLIRRGRIQAVKFTSNSSFESLDALINVARIPPENIVVRLYMPGNDPNLRDPNLFHFFSSAWITHAISRRVLRFEIHNEPNLLSEGLGFAWTSAAGFASWYEVVRIRIKAEFPQALVGFPGLSPQPNVTDWLTACAGVIGKSDWVGAHAYWQVVGVGTFGMLNADSGGMYWKRYATRFPGKPIYLTEFSNNASVSVTPKHEKGVQYAAYYDIVREPVVAAFSFLSSAPGSDYPNETWAGSDIADIVGARGW